MKKDFSFTVQQIYVTVILTQKTENNQKMTEAIENWCACRTSVEHRVFLNYHRCSLWSATVSKIIVCCFFFWKIVGMSVEFAERSYCIQ